MDNEAVVKSFFASWEAQDVELAAMHFHDDMVYQLHSATKELPYTGMTRGKAACRDLLFTIIRDFDYLKYEAHINSVEDDIVRAWVSFRYQHRASGEVLDGTRRLVFQVKDGLIVRMDRYHDDQLVDAFMRMTQHHMTIRKAEILPGLRSIMNREQVSVESVEPSIMSEQDALHLRRRREPDHSEGS